MVPPTPAETRCLSEYLLEGEDALGRLYQDCIGVVFRDDPRAAVPSRLGPAARNVYFVMTLGGEIINGGVSQFFSNSSGSFVDETFAALRAIGAAHALGLLERALVAFGGALPPRDRGARCDQLFAFEEREPDALESIDRAFYDDITKSPREDVNALLLVHVREHAGAPLCAEACSE